MSTVLLTLISYEEDFKKGGKDIICHLLPKIEGELLIIDGGTVFE